MNLIKTLVAGAAAIAGVSAASAADLPARFAAPAPTPVFVATTPYDWTGFYAGVHGSYAFAAPTDYTVEGFDFSQTARGAMGGVQAGFQQQFGRLVVGLEASASFGNVSKRADVLDVGVGAETKITQLYTITPRLGLAFDRLMIFGKAGYAGAQVKPSLYDGIFGGSGGAFHHGWTVGGGAEYAFTNHWTIGLEYNYVRLSDRGHTTSIDGFPITINAQPDLHIGRIGLNYKF